MTRLTVLVTGSAGGIGQVLCREFSAAGYRVIGIDRQGGTPGVDHVLRTDLVRFTRDEAYRGEVAAAVRGLLGAGGLDVLVNNAAVQSLGSTETLSETSWRETFDVNVLAPFLLVQQLLPQLESGRGCVINISSIHASLTKPGFVAYASSKAALVGLTRSLAVDLGGRVRVNAICPAAIGDTAMLEEGFAGTPEARARLAAAHPAGRLGAPEDVARCALFLAAGGSGFLTGAVLGLDGGMASRLHDPI